MNDKPHSCCDGDNPVLALFLVRLGVGLFFLLSGLMKLFMMGPDAVAEMMIGLFGVQDMAASLLAWVTIFTEIVGGVMLLLGKLVPRILYKISLLGFIIIDIVGFVFAHWLPTETRFDAMQFLWHLMLLLVLLGLFVVAPKSPCGVIGDDTCCDVEKRKA